MVLKKVLCILSIFNKNTFQAILSDLFPGVEIPEHDYGRLKEEIINVQLSKGKILFKDLQSNLFYFF